MANELPQESSRQIEFSTGILPILTKAGCNSGACHGAATGRGEFRLSLFGSNPEADHFAIVRHLNSRRVNLAFPEKSLVVLKPSGEVDHAGGVRFTTSSSEAARLRQWIRLGAHFGDRRKAVSLRSDPPSVVVERGQTAAIHFAAVLSDGSTIDVSHLVAVTNADPESLQVDLPDLESPPGQDTESAGVRVTAGREGRHLVTARFPGVVVATEVLVPSQKPVPPKAIVATQEIDRLQQRRFETMRIEPSSPVDDVEFIHRASLLLTGRRPVWDDVDSFTKNQDTNKRERLIEELLKSPDFVDYWSWQLSRQWRVTQAPTSEAASAWHNWIRKSVQDDAGLFLMLETMIAANGSPADNPPAAFSTVSRDARQQAEYFSEAFLGLRLRCANCHDHPLDRWTQEDHHGLAAVFARVTRDPVVADRPQGININPATGQPAIPRLLSGKALTDPTRGRQELVSWVSGDGSRLVASHFVNFVWKQLMGRGLVEPADDLRSTNPPVHPEVFEHLVSQFIQSGGKLRPLIHEICVSQAFERGSPALDTADHMQFGSSRQPVPLPPEILLDQLTQVTNSPGRALDPASRSIRPESNTGDLAELRVQSGCLNGCITESPQATLSLALEMINGRIVNERVSPDSRIIQSLKELQGNDHIMIQRLYEWTLGRQPLESEMTFWLHQWKSSQTQTNHDAGEFFTDAVWTLVTSDEFRSAP
ncbi:MAG: DUF1549 domain-containing protein [Planctomycetaceae bacterium]